MDYIEDLQQFLEKKSSKQKLVVIYGPTASGKTDMSIDIARYLDTEIISTDSRQIFKGMDIWTGKITPDEMKWVPHHMLDIIKPDEDFSVWDFKFEANKIMQKLIVENKVPMLVWGTGLYIDSIIYNFSLPKVPADHKLREELSLLSKQELYQRLQEIDPEYALELHPNNRPYVERALEVKMLTGKSKTEFRTQRELLYDVLFLSPDYSDRSKLYDRINLRVEMMFDNWAEQEVRKLTQMWYTEKDFGMNSIWYREFFPYLEWKIDKQEVIRQIQQNSRNYAKRQITWFRKYKDT